MVCHAFAIGAYAFECVFRPITHRISTPTEPPPPPPDPKNPKAQHVAGDQRAATGESVHAAGAHDAHARTCVSAFICNPGTGAPVSRGHLSDAVRNLPVFFLCCNPRIEKGLSLTCVHSRKCTRGRLCNVCWQAQGHGCV